MIVLHTESASLVLKKVLDDAIPIIEITEGPA